MKKWMNIVLIGACTAGLAAAENAVPWYKKLFNKNADEQTQVIPPAPAPETVTPPVQAVRPETAVKQRSQLTPEQIEKFKTRKEAAQIMYPEQMEKIKAHREALMKLGEAARNETDPVKKEALVAELRAKVTEGMDKMLTEQKKRLEQAEAELPKLKERLADAEKNKAARIEEQVQRILAGEPLKRHEGKRPELPRDGKHKNSKELKPFAAE